MASKDTYSRNGGVETEHSEEGLNPAKLDSSTENSSSSPQQEVETLPQFKNKMPDVAGHEGKKKGNDAGHGNRFQSKLLILYAVRAINLNYQFYLGTELPVGEKFDDLIFHYKDQNDVTFRQQYLQAKHILNENKMITADNLLETNDGNFSLLKYFQSFVKIKGKGNDIEHCIICTNVDFNHRDLFEELEKHGMILLGILKSHWPKLLNCRDIKNDQACYKLKNLDNFKNTLLFRNIINCVTNCTGKEMKKLYGNCTKEVDGKPFNDLTADEMKIFFINSRNQNQLVQIVFDDFLEKMIFVVKTPNETKLDKVLRDEVGKYFELRDAALQSAYVMDEMVNWFKLPDKEHHWLTPEEAKEILKTNAAHIKVIELTALSLNYQGKLKQIESSGKDELEFKDTAIDELTAMLQLFWDSQEKIKHVRSKTPKLTAVKVFSAIKKLTEFSKKDDYLVISSKRLEKNQTEIIESLKAHINNGHRLLVVVNKDAGNPLRDESYLEFISEKKKGKVIVVSNQNGSKESYQDTITFGQLNENTKKVLEDKQVSFQGNYLTVNALIDMKQANEADKILDSQLIENLMQMAEGIVIPSFNTSNIGKYIERKLKFPSKDELLKKLADIEEKPDKKFNEQIKVGRKKMNEEIEIDQNGKFKWKTDDGQRKLDIWKELKILLEQKNSSDLSLLSTVNERELIDGSNKRIIITDVAGTGKSTILSHYYEKIKKVNPDKLVIKISLMNYSKELVNESSINEFLINNVVHQNIFARSLLKHRLETGDRIILMLDGFDEIDYECQSKVVELVKTLNESIPLYITTRPHLADQLQFELSQLAYRLDRFTEEDQINYLTLVWEEYLINNKVAINEETIKKFARQLIDRVNQTLKDKEKEFIGIPLQCRILAECFQSKIKDEIVMKPNEDDLSYLVGEEQKFDLADLYKSLIEEKRRVFRQEKIPRKNFEESYIVNASIELLSKKTERHLRKLAVQLIVNKQEDVNILIPVGFKSKSEKEKKEKQLNEFGIRFGLVDDKGENGIQFLHRTYAEYLVADFIFNGFLLDEEKHNNLLENESARKWIIEEMLMKDNYEGVRVFFDSMLKEIILKEEWKNKIQNNDLRLRFPQIASLLPPEEEEKIWPLERAFEEINATITLFIFDCLEVTFHETPLKIPSAIQHSLRIKRREHYFDKQKFFFRQRIDVFDRLLNYFDNVDYEEFSQFIEELCYELNGEQQQIEKNKLERFLVFVARHAKNDFHFLQLIVFFIRSKMEEQIRRHFFEIFTSKYSIDFHLTRLMKSAIDESLKRHDCQISEIESALTILRDLGRINVAGQLSRFVVLCQFEKFQEKGNDSIRLSLEKMGMTGLHWAAFTGDLSLLEREIGFSLENPENCSEEERNYFFQLMTNEGDLVPPFYLAVAYGHKEIYQKTFYFLDLKKEISDTKEFFHQVLEDAIEYENVVMIQTFFNRIKEIQGRNYLVKLLQAVISSIRFKLNKIPVETIIDIFMQDTENGCKDLNDLVFYDWNTLQIGLLKHVECDVLQKMISAAGGLHNWIKRLIDTNLVSAFKVLSFNGFFNKLNQENQISKLIDTLITRSLPNNRRTILRERVIDIMLSTSSSTLDDNKPTETSRCYWSDFVLKTSSSWNNMKKFLAAISKCANEEDLKRLLLYRDDNNILILLQFLIFNGRDDFNKILTILPENLRKEIEDLSEEEEPELIDHFFSTPTFLESLDRYEQFNAIKYFLENGNEEQLTKFSQVVKVDQLKKNIEKIMGYGNKIGNKIAGLLKEKLDSQTVIKYKEIIEKYSS